MVMLMVVVRKKEVKAAIDILRPCAMAGSGFDDFIHTREAC